MAVVAVQAFPAEDIESPNPETVVQVEDEPSNDESDLEGAESRYAGYGRGYGGYGRRHGGWGRGYGGGYGKIIGE